MANTNAFDLTREIVIKCGVYFDEYSSAIFINHTSYATTNILKEAT